MAKEGKRSVQTEMWSLQCNPYPASQFFKYNIFLIKTSICSKKYTYILRKPFTLINDAILTYSIKYRYIKILPLTSTCTQYGMILHVDVFKIFSNIM